MSREEETRELRFLACSFRGLCCLISPFYICCAFLAQNSEPGRRIDPAPSPQEKRKSGHLRFRADVLLSLPPLASKVIAIDTVPRSAPSLSLDPRRLASRSLVPTNPPRAPLPIGKHLTVTE